MARQSLPYLVRAEKGATVERLKGSSVIPSLGNDEEEDTRNVDVWATWRAQQIIDRVLKPQSKDGE